MPSGAITSIARAVLFWPKFVYPDLSLQLGQVICPTFYLSFRDSSCHHIGQLQPILLLRLPTSHSFEPLPHAF